METCRVNPCANGGWCESLPISYKCHCEPGWHGVNCQTEIDECMQREGDPEPPCKNSELSPFLLCAEYIHPC